MIQIQPSCYQLWNLPVQNFRNNRVSSGYILDNMCLGPYFFEVGLVLRNSLFLNGILTNLEASYVLTDAEIIELEQMDISLITNVLLNGVLLQKSLFINNYNTCSFGDKIPCILTCHLITV